MEEKKYGLKREPIRLSLPQEELNSLNDQDTSIIEDTKNIGRAMDEAVGVGGASGLAKYNSFVSSYYRDQATKLNLTDEKREKLLEKADTYKGFELKNKEEYKEWRETYKNTLNEIDNPVLKFIGNMSTGMLADYSDWANLNEMIAINAVTQGFGGGLSKLRLLVTDMAMGGVEEGYLNLKTQVLMKDGEVDHSEVLLSTLYGALGETVFPMVRSASGMAFGKVIKKFGNETADEISSNILKEMPNKFKADIEKSRIKDLEATGIADFDKKVINEASTIENNLNNIGTITGNLRVDDDSVITVNGKQFGSDIPVEEKIAEWKENSTGRTLEKEKEILDNIEAQLKEMSKETDIDVDDLAESELRYDDKGNMIRNSDFEADLNLFGKGSQVMEEVTPSKGRIERDPLTSKIAVNDIDVDKVRAKEQILVPKDLNPKREFKKIVDVEEDIAQEIILESEIASSKSIEIGSILDEFELKGDTIETPNVDKINDFIEEYDLEDTIPLIDTKIDGTLDLGGKTKEQFIKDFKIELQLFSDPIAKDTPEEIFKNITMRRASKIVKENKDALKEVIKKTKEKLNRPLKLSERDKIVKNLIKEKLYNSYKYAENRAMTRLHFNTSLDIDGNRYGATEIFNLLETDKDFNFLSKAMFDNDLKTQTPGTGEAMRSFLKRFDDSIKLFVEGNFKTDYDNVHMSLAFDSKKLYTDSVNDADMLRITNQEGELDFSKISPEEKAEIDVFAFDAFAYANKDILNTKTAKIFWDNFSMHGKASSGLEGTVLHGMGEFQKFYDEIVIDKATLKKLTERYLRSDRSLYNKMVESSTNASALYSTFGYKPKNSMNRMFGNYTKANPLTKKFTWLFGEGSQAWTLKTNINEYANMIFADEIGRSRGQMPFKAQKFFNWKAKGDSIMLGLTERPVEVATHVAKRMIVGKEPMHKVVFQTVHSIMQMHALTKKIANETNNTFLKEHVGALGSLYEFMITKGDNDYSGAWKDGYAKMTPKQKVIFNLDKGVSKLNQIRQVDLFGDKLALLGTHMDIDKFGKIGYQEIMSQSKYNYLASKLDEFGISEYTFDLMVNAKRGDFGIRDYSTYTRKELGLGGGDPTQELRKMEDFSSFYASKIGFTKPDVEFSKAKNVYRSEDDRFLTALNMYWKKTMYTKLKDGASLLGTMNTYGGVGKTFDWLNMDHYTRIMKGAIAIGVGGYASDRMDEIVYGYDLDKAENLTELIMLIFNQFGAYTLTDQTSLMRNLGLLLNGKTMESKIKAMMKLTLPSKPIREIERLIDED